MRTIETRFKPMWRALLVVFGLAAGAAAAADVLAPHISPTLAAPGDGSARRPVLVELFTSEGCSSCPPADALLARLDQEQFVPGAQAIVLSEHVTYWNQQGWRDPFSLDDVTSRQQQYRIHFGLDGVYTPQAVVDGATQVVGNDTEALARAIAKAASAPGLDLEIADAAWSGGAVQFKLRVGSEAIVDDSAAHNASITAVLAEDSAQTAVKSGENAGRTLRHVSVVRVIREIGKGALDGRDLSLKPPAGVGQSGSVRLIVFATDRHSGRVIGVAEQKLTHLQGGPTRSVASCTQHRARLVSGFLPPRCEP